MSWIKFFLTIFAATLGFVAAPALLAAPQDFQSLASEVSTEIAGGDLAATKIVVGVDGLEDAWIEVTHLASDLPSELVLVDRQQSSDELWSFVPDLPAGPTMLCTGARDLGVFCEQIYRGADEYFGWPEVEAIFTPGLELRGLYDQDLTPVAGARVALVPAELEAFRPFTLPLEVRGRRVSREVRTDEEGAFRIPAVGAGDYFLEAVLPSGRVHRSEPFYVPERAVLERQLRLSQVSAYPEDRVVPTEDTAVPAEDSAVPAEDSAVPTEGEPSLVDTVEVDAVEVDTVEVDAVEVDAVDSEPLFIDLGRIDVPSGLDIEIRLFNQLGEPIAGAIVSANQGRQPGDLTSFETSSNAAGRAVLHGLDVERPVRLKCEKEGFQPIVREYDLLPVSVDCAMRAWGWVLGEVIGVGGQVPAGATVEVQALSLAGDPRSPESGVDEATAGKLPEPLSVRVAGGVFVIDTLAAGEYELSAAAPGYQVEKRTFVIEDGQEIDLGPLLLLFAREIDGLVVDAVTGDAIVGVDIVSLSPPGAVNTYSDQDGEFLFSLGGEQTVVLELSTFDYAARRITLHAEDLDDREPLIVELEPAGWILVEVEDEGGRRCQGCRVVIWPDGEELWTDGLGEALSGPLGAGTYRVSRPRVTHLGSTVIEQPGAEMYRVRVKPGRLSVVRLASEGQPLEIRFDGDLDGLWMLSAQSSRRSEKVFADQDGAFPIRQRKGEKLDLFLHTYDQELGQELAIWQGTLPDNLLSDRISIRLSESVVEGQAFGLAGPLAGTQVRLIDFANATLRAVSYVDSEGTFRLPQVRPGVYNLYIGARSVKFVSVIERRKIDLGRFEIFLSE